MGVINLNKDIRVINSVDEEAAPSGAQHKIGVSLPFGFYGDEPVIDALASALEDLGYVRNSNCR